MKTCKYLLVVFLSIGFCLSASTSHAQIFGSDEKKWEHVFNDLKKISIRLTDNVEVQLKALQASEASLLSQLDGIKNAVPALQGAVEQNDAKVTQRLDKMDDRLLALETKIRAQLDDQKKSQLDTSNALRQGLAGDMDNLAKRTGESQATVSSGFANIETNNKKMIEILATTLKENQNLGIKIDGNFKAMEEKINNSMLKIDPGMANLDLANQKLSKLIEILKAFAAEQERIVSSQAEMSKTLSEMRGKTQAHPANGEVKKSVKKPAAEGKSKKAEPAD